ncbi:hypothetical protein [Parasphingorhabdus sp.]|jgi:hypothetical protein|uniref:hypothetical protein n=1 Tax=Parasphingorhabdus sp. TaxID=2709688 RepID=UPI003BB1E3F8
MVELKIFLLLLIWPDGQDQGNPLWTSEAFETVAECQEYAATAIEEAIERHGADVQTQFHCLNKDSRIAE